jgi:galactokinase
MGPADWSTRLDALRDALGGREIRFVRAPGRVNLIGDHTDYQGGLCLPIAIDRDVVIGFRPRADGRIRVRSLDLDAEIELPPIAADADLAGIEPWARSVGATVASLVTLARIPFPGFDAAITSSIPIGAGLSSSAAFEVALAIVSAALAGVTLAPLELARLAQAVELRASGVPCGIMDQLASVAGRPGHALLIDCRTFEIAPVPIPDRFGVLVIHSGLERRLADSAYAQRRAACEAAAARLGLATLRDATPEQVADDPIARHVVSENARVETFADALRIGDARTAGALMLESHRSLRDDFEVSTPELDLLVGLGVDAGAFGARLTGAGFGGCVVALVARADWEAVAAEITGRYRAETGLEPTAFAVSAVEGAGFIADPT